MRKHYLDNPADAKKFWLTLAAIAFIAIWFIPLGTRVLLNPDEGRYAEIAREMSATDDWVTPRLNGLKYFEKPALQYWLTAKAYETFGQNAFAARFWSGCTGFLGVLLAGFAAARLFGQTARWLAASLLASSLMYMVIAHINILDMGLCFFLELALVSFLLAQIAPLHSRAERKWMLIAWAAVALGFLSKGLIALLLPTLSLLLYSLVTRELSAWKRLHVRLGLPLFLILSAPWIIAVSKANPEFPKFFFLHEHFTRFLTPVHHHDAPGWHVWMYFFMGTLPWTFLLLQHLTAAWRGDSTQIFQTRRFLSIWIVTIIGFFSFSHSKLPPYILPALPAAALLLSDALIRETPRILQRHLLSIAVLCLITGFTVLALPLDLFAPKTQPFVTLLRPWVALALLVMTLGAAWGGWIAQKQNVRALLIAAVGTVLGLSILLQASNILRHTRSGYDLAMTLAPLINNKHKLYSVETYDQTLPFYLDRTFTVAGYRGELDFGLNAEPHLGLADRQAFIADWLQQTDAIAIMRPELYQTLVQQGVPMQLIAQQKKLVAVKKP